MRTIRCFLALCALCAVLLVGCAETQPEPVVVAGDDGESETVTIAIANGDLTADETLDEAQITCETLYRDGRVSGFTLHFAQTPALDALFSDADNLYFGTIDDGRRTISVPMESVRVLADSGTGTFAVTLLSPSDALSDGTCTVSFYVALREGDASHALFCAQKTVEIEA